jgi:hypothetical protein
MHTKWFILYTIFVCLACNNNGRFSVETKSTRAVAMSDEINPYRTINEVPLPPGYTRFKKDQGSFAGWLLNVKLKKDKTVYKFDGRPKSNQAAQFAVLDISVGNTDLQQCADAVMRLRAEYLFASAKYNDIHFTDNAGKIYQFNKPFTGRNLHQYLQKVFGMCGSASLAKQLNSISFKEIKPGDVIIRGGFPGHAVMVMDVAKNAGGTKIYLLAQSYMPAQDIHILLNPMTKELSPWYQVDDGALIITPEYSFGRNELMRWREF